MTTFIRVGTRRNHRLGSTLTIMADKHCERCRGQGRYDKEMKPYHKRMYCPCLLFIGLVPRGATR